MYSFDESDDLQKKQALDKLKVMLTVCRYNCVAVQLQRGMKRIFFIIENKYLIQKAKTFYFLKKYAEIQITNKIKKVVEKNLHRMGTLVQTKLYNHQYTAFCEILGFSARNRKLKKYMELENADESHDAEIELKNKQLQRLNRKYNRLIAELAILSQRSKKHVYQN